MQQLSLEAGPWTFDVNNPLTLGTDFTTTTQYAMMTFKEIMTNLGWSVVASSNSVSVKNIGDSSPDLWSSISNIVFNSSSGPRSWIIFYDSVTTFYLFVHCNLSDGAYDATVGYYYLGDIGTNGTTSALPTGTTLTFNNSATYSIFNWYITGTPIAYMHGMKPADGKGLRIFTFVNEDSGNCCTGCLFIDLLANTPSTFDGDAYFSTYNTIYGLPSGSAENSPQGATFIQTPYKVNFKLTGQSRVVHSSSYVTCEQYLSGTTFAALQSRPTLYQGWQSMRVGVFSDSYGYFGRLRDLWMGAQYQQSLITYPSDSSYAFCKFGCLIVPWAGVVPLGF